MRTVSIQHILSGINKLPYTSRPAWLALQSECADLRRTHAHLKQGTRPSKKQTNIKDIKRYLNVATVGKDGLLVVKRNDPLAPSRECIIVPRQVLDGLLTALHIQLDHPSSHQMKLVMKRYFFALDMEKSIDKVSDTCHPCASLRKVPHTVIKQSTSDPPETVAVSFSADVIKRCRQLILVVRETVTSYTVTAIIENERHDTLRDMLIRLSVELRPLDGPMAVIRTDPAPGFVALVNDEILRQNRLTIEIGRVKNANKNPVAERAIQELELEILKQEPGGGPVTHRTLALTTASLNSRIRSNGLSAREVWTQRDQFTGDQIPLSDQKLILEQESRRKSNHPFSEKSKAPVSSLPIPTAVEIGDLVYVHTDRDKTCARDRYLVVSKDGEWLNVRKFSGAQLRKTSYRIKDTECFKVPPTVTSDHYNENRHVYDDEDSDEDSSNSVQPPPEIPLEIATPLPLVVENVDRDAPVDENSAVHVPRRSTVNPQTAMGHMLSIEYISDTGVIV